ncbi:uncharacterized protein LOC119746293 [Patiria miniata]|uniref:Uncharacterized protein n=1 Tax=Patiria miniata TaxID=46514 RepID=A0A914BS08_PATMI|nr:uncharacterized protein LOC119746293 [Patiria miniata]
MYTTSEKTRGVLTPTVNRDKLTTSLPFNCNDCPPSSNPSVVRTVVIAGIVFAVLVIVVSIYNILHCVRYDPKRLRQLIGCCSRSKTPNRQSDPNDPSNLQMDRRPYESSIAGPTSDQPEHIEYMNVDVNAGSSTEHPRAHDGSVELPMDSAVPPSGRSRQSAQDAVETVEDPSYDWPAQSAHEDNSATGKPTDGYMELQEKPHTAVYTELKL